MFGNEHASRHWKGCGLDNEAMVWQDLFSRKNRVSVVRHNGLVVVRKRFSCEESYEREKEAYQLLAKTPIPRPRVMEEYAQNCMYYEYIDAPTVCDLLESAEKGEVSEETIIKVYLLMVDWIDLFHQATHTSMGDVNARNFLFDGEVIYGLDFENTQQDRCVEEDIGQVLAFLMCYTPMDSKLKKKVFESVIEHASGPLAYDESTVRQAYIRERQILTDRRKSMR